MNAANMIGIGQALQNVLPDMEKRKQQKFQNSIETRRLDLEQQRNEEAVQQRALQMAMLQANRDELNANRRLGRDQTMAENLSPTRIDPSNGVGQNTISSLHNAGFGSLLQLDKGNLASTPNIPKVNTIPPAIQPPTFGGQQNAVPQIDLPQLGTPIPAQAESYNWPGTAKTQETLSAQADRARQNQIIDTLRQTAETRQQNAADSKPDPWGMAAFMQNLRNSAPGSQTPFQPLGVNGKPLPGMLNYNVKTGKLEYQPFPEGVLGAGKWGANSGRNPALYRDNATSRAMTDIDTTLQESLRLRGLLEKANLHKDNNPIGPAFANWLATGLGIDPSDPDAKGMAVALSKGDRTQAAGFIQGMATKAMLQGSGARGQIIQQTLGRHILDPKFSNKQAHQVMNDMIREYINLRENTQRKSGVSYEQDPFTQSYDPAGVILPEAQPVDQKTFRGFGIPTGGPVYIDQSKVLPTSR